MFNTNMVNGIHAVVPIPFSRGLQKVLSFPMFLVEHQPMELTGELEMDKKLDKWEQDIYKQYSEINPDNCPPVRMARAICHQCETKTVFIGPLVKIGSILKAKDNQTFESAAQSYSIELAIKKLIVFLKSYYIDAAPCSSH
jgi:hypothetical protein